MSDVRIMKKIIIQIYNNLQLLWSSKVKFVSLSHLLGCPLFGSNSGLFTIPGFIVSHLFFQCPLYFLVFYLQNAGVVLAVRFVPQVFHPGTGGSGLCSCLSCCHLPLYDFFNVLPNWIANILLRIFVSLFIRDIGL